MSVRDKSAVRVKDLLPATGIKAPQYAVTALITIKDGQARIASDHTIWPAARVVVGAELKGEIPWYVVESDPRVHAGGVRYARAIPVFPDDETEVIR